MQIMKRRMEHVGEKQQLNKDDLFPFCNDSINVNDFAATRKTTLSGNEARVGLNDYLSRESITQCA